MGIGDLGVLSFLLLEDQERLIHTPSTAINRIHNLEKNLTG